MLKLSSLTLSFRALCVSGALLSLSTVALAADTTRFWDPHPDKEDVVISLPCDLSMAFRKVYTSDAPERMDDTDFEAGRVDGVSAVSESRNQRYIQGPFHDRQGYYYLMGKYEVTELQYQALTQGLQGKCPKPNNKLTLPKTKVSWFDAINVARNLSLFMAKDKNALRQDGDLAFARLPTDSEFEFAVRGGKAVTRSVFEAPTFITEGSLSEYAWYSSPQSAAGRINRIGMKKPNPLGLYDLLGNVQEMTQDQFYATRLGRLHGQSGGFIVRGGSYLTLQTDMVSALRVEKPFYTDKGTEFTAPDTGFRLVLSLPVLNSRDDVTKLNAEVEKLGYDEGVGGNEGTVAKLDRIIAANQALDKEKASLSEQNDKLNDALNALRQDMLEANAERDRQRDHAIVAAMRLGGFLCSNVATMQEVVLIGEKSLKAREAQSAKNPANEMLKKLRDLEEGKLQDSRNTLEFYLSYYADHLADSLSNYTPVLLERQLGNARLSLGSRQSDLALYIEEFLKHVKYREGHKSTDLKELYKYYTEHCYALHQGHGK
ncbi:MAG TPA: SUMF1/EgtB/PvdO family nonheme iron enzyme [Candidatus Avisuccinivibrio pullicola]|nr:SUMF1/EgtB/PvdO family nonheme iron enzyme [Candidatus Avisuccinivibrio pullicola]